MVLSIERRQKVSFYAWTRDENACDWEQRRKKYEEEKFEQKHTQKKDCFYENIRFFLSEPVRVIPGREFTYFFSEKAFA